MQDELRERVEAQLQKQKANYKVGASKSNYSPSKGYAGCFAHKVVLQVLLTSKQKLPFSIQSIHRISPFDLKPAKPREQPDVSLCRYQYRVIHQVWTELLLT